MPLPGEYPLWASLPNAAGLSYAPVSWNPTGAWRYRVYEATEAALLAACGEPGPVLSDRYGVRMQRLFDLHRNAGNLAAIKAAYRKLGGEPISPPVQPDGTMRVESLLPRGSSLIHCFVVVGVSETNVISGWPVPDANGRRSFLAYAIPTPLRPPMPEIRAVLTETGPMVTVDVGGAVPVTRVELYRAMNPVLARHTGTMDRVASVAPDPSDWHRTVIADPAAPVGRDRLQYRAVARPSDDRDAAAMAVASPESRAYALLNPPPDAPDLLLAEDAAASSLTVAVVRVVTSAPRRRKQIGDHTVSWLARPAGKPAVRRSVVPPELDDHPSIAAFVASGTVAGWIGGVLQLRLDRTGGEAVGLTVDVTDPLGRTAHAVLDVAEHALGSGARDRRSRSPALELDAEPCGRRRLPRAERPAAAGCSTGLDRADPLPPRRPHLRTDDDHHQQRCGAPDDRHGGGHAPAVVLPGPMGGAARPRQRPRARLVPCADRGRS